MAARVESPPDGERKYHSFYQLLSGASAEEKARRKLGKPEEFGLLRKSACMSVEGIDDAKEWKATLHAMVGCPVRIWVHPP